MKKFVCIMLVLVLAIPFIFAGGSRDGGTKNKIVIYTSMYEDIIIALQKDLKQQFPKYDIEFVYGGTGSLKAKIAAEQASARLGCDILMVADPAYSLELKDKKMLHPYKSSHAENLIFDYDPDGYWYPVRISNMVLAYNPERTDKNSIPDSFHGFANDARVRDTIAMNNPLVSGTAMAAIIALNTKYGAEYFSALGRQNIHIEYGTMALDKLETGAYKIAMVLEEQVLRKRQVEDSKLEVIYPSDGTIMIPSTIMIINDQWSANGNTSIAEAITDWFLSEAGQNAIVNGWMHSVRTGFSQQPYDAVSTDEIRANSMPVNWDYTHREKILDSFEENITHNR